MGKLNKSERHMSFILKLYFFFLYYREKIDLLQVIDAANFEEVNKVKLYILPSKFQTNITCNTYPTKLPSPSCLFLLVCFFFLFVLLWESFRLIVTLSYLHYFE